MVYTIATVLKNTVAEIFCHCIHSDLVDQPPWVQGLGQVLSASELAFDNCKSELNWIELGAVRQKIQDTNSGCLTDLLDSLASMYHSIVQYQDQVLAWVWTHARILNQETLSALALGDELIIIESSPNQTQETSQTWPF